MKSRKSIVTFNISRRREVEQSKETRVTVAQFLTQHIDACGRTQKEIAAEVGYDCANMITMMKQGMTKVPLNKVGPLARALGIASADFLHMVMAEYMPDTLAAVGEILPVLSRSERQVIQALRRIRNESNAEPVVCDARDVVALVMV
jgi:hypothetical protein